MPWLWRRARPDRRLLGNGTAQRLPVLALIGVLEVEQVVVQVDHRGRAVPAAERVDRDELAQPEERGEGAGTGAAMRLERGPAQVGRHLDLLPVRPAGPRPEPGPGRRDKAMAGGRMRRLRPSARHRRPRADDEDGGDCGS